MHLDETRDICMEFMLVGRSTIKVTSQIANLSKQDQKLVFGGISVKNLDGTVQCLKYTIVSIMTALPEEPDLHEFAISEPIDHDMELGVCLPKGQMDQTTQPKLQSRR